MGWRNWIVTTEWRVSLDDAEAMLGTRGEFPTPHDPEPYLRAYDRRGDTVACVQPVRRSRIMVTVDDDWQNWPAEWSEIVTAKLGGPIQGCFTLDYQNRADIEGINPESIMDELVATAERANFLCFVWLRIVNEIWQWPAVMAFYNTSKQKFNAFTADETLADRAWRLALSLNPSSCGALKSQSASNRAAGGAGTQTRIRE